MRKTSLFLKLALGLLVAIFVLVSCAEEVTPNKNVVVTIGGTTVAGAAKGLVANYGTLNEADYYWWYKTTVTNNPEGTNPAYKDVQTLWTPDGTTGLANNGQTFGEGDWTLELWAYSSETSLNGGSVPTTASGLTFYGVAYFKVDVDGVYGNVTTTSNFYNADGSEGYVVYVPMQYVDLDDFDANDDAFVGENGKIQYAYSSVTTFDSTYEAQQDAIYDWYKYTTISDLATSNNQGNVWDASSNTNVTIEDVVYTDVGVKPSTFNIETLYDSLGVYYKLTETVDVHSNKTVKITGSFDNRFRKTFKVFFHDGKILNADNTVNTASTEEFSGDEAVVFNGYEVKHDENNVPYIEFQYEDDVVLPSLASTTDSNFKKGYGFWGWYLTDTDWNIDDSVTRTAGVPAAQTSGSDAIASFVRTSGTTQTIYVAQALNGTTTSDHDFEEAYGLLIPSISVDDGNVAYAGLWNSADYVYEIHLFARWVELTKQVGATTTASDVISLYDSKFHTIWGDGYVHLTIVEGSDTVQGWKNFTSQTFWKTSQGDFITDEAGLTEGETYTMYSIDGWYAKDSTVLVLTNEGILARLSAGLVDYISDGTKQSNGKQIPAGTWISQGGTEVKLYAHWNEQVITYTASVAP